MGEHQARVIEYQRAENAALLERVGKHRLRLTDGERRRLAKLGRALGRKALQQVATIATPDTILRWYRELVVAKYNGSKKRGPGRPKKAEEIVRLLLEMATRNTTWGTWSITTVSGTTKVSTTFCSRARRCRRMRTVGCNGASGLVACSTSIIGMRPDRCSIVFWDRTRSARPRSRGQGEEGPKSDCVNF